MPKTPEESKYRISDDFQLRLKSLIEDCDMTKKDFARAVGISQEVIIRATVYGIVPSVKSLVKLCDFLRCPIFYLLGETEDCDFIPAQSPATFFDRLKALTAEKGIKYSALSHVMSFAPNSVYEWFRTNSLPSLDYLRELADYFGVSVDYLLGRTDYRK